MDQCLDHNYSRIVNLREVFIFELKFIQFALKVTVVITDTSNFENLNVSFISPPFGGGDVRTIKGCEEIVHFNCHLMSGLMSMFIIL